MFHAAGSNRRACPPSSYAAQDQIAEFNEKIKASGSKRAGDDAGDEDGDDAGDVAVAGDVGADYFDALELDDAYDESELLRGGVSHCSGSWARRTSLRSARWTRAAPRTLPRWQQATTVRQNPRHSQGHSREWVPYSQRARGYKARAFVSLKGCTRRWRAKSYDRTFAVRMLRP